MATIKYLLQSNSQNAPIYLRLSLARNTTVKRKTGLHINFKNWSSATGLPKQNNSINKNITSKLNTLRIFEANTLQKIERQIRVNYILLSLNFPG
jgi:hypothetical protein